MNVYKLDRHGIRSHANNFFRTYHTNRFQYTLINGKQSALNAVKCEETQGSILGSLFMPCIYTIYMEMNGSIVRFFADDTDLYIRNENLPTLVGEIKIKYSHIYS